MTIFSSIRQRLLFSLLLIISVLGLLTLARSYFDARYEVQELFDAHLAESARLIQAQLLFEVQNNTLEIQKLLDTQSHFPAPHTGANNASHEEASPYGHEYERKIAFQLWDRKKNLLLQSASAPARALSKPALEPRQRGYIDEKIDNESWRVFSLWDNKQQYLVQVGERYAIRNELIQKISVRLIKPFLISIPLTALLIWISVGSGLSPLRKVATEVTQRDPDYLEPVKLGQVPSEIKPLIESLNKLFVRLAQAFEKERRFTDDAAHELRTPLAALKTQAQVALRASEAEQRLHALQQVVEGVDRANHLLEQMLTLTRLNPDRHEPTKISINLRQAIAEVISQLYAKANNKHITVELSGESDICILAEATSLEILLRNVIDNAINYTPEHGRVSVHVQQEGNTTLLTVTDTGPGIAAELQGRVFDRFYRVLGHDTIGCGLGLTIARQSAELLNAELSLHNADNNSGLVVEIRFL